MKKILTLLLVLAAATGKATGIDHYYLTLSQSDTLRISPNALNFYVNVPVIAEFDNGVCDHWRVEMVYPDELSWAGAVNAYSANGPEYGINIPYVQSDGSDAIFEPTMLTILEETQNNATTYKRIFECSTTVYGYWDYNNDGIYEPYGKVKWGPGRYNRFFDIHFRVDGDCTGDSIVIDGQMSCSYDTRYPTYLIDTSFCKVIHLVVAYLLGDVNGDEVVNMNDVTALIDSLTDELAGMSPYQLDAADVNHDGNVTIADVTALIDLLLGQGTYNVEDFEDL